MHLLRLLAGVVLSLILLVAASLFVPHSTAAVQPDVSTQTTEIPSTTPTEEPDTAALEAAWRDWMVRHEITQSTLAIGQHDAIIKTADAGRSAQTAYPVASLSKAITAMCLNALLEQSPYDWSSPLSNLKPVWDTLGMSPNPELGKLSLAALVTHTSGLPKNIDAEESAGEGRNLYTQAHFARSALRDAAHLGDDRSHSYSNVNFALLGQIIEGFTKQTYGEYCAQTVMAPAGATSAQVGGRMWATAGFGGWSVSATDYARFLMHWYAPDQPWMRAPADFPLDRESGAGLGVYNDYEGGHHIVNHTGLWKSKVAERQIGAMFVLSDTGAVIVANWQGSLPSEAYTDLGQSIIAALH